MQAVDELVGHRWREAVAAQARREALAGAWADAIATNRMLLERYPDDVDTLNRYAHALVQSGEISQAQLVYDRALALAPTNVIARAHREAIAEHRLREPAPRRTQVRWNPYLLDVGVTTTAQLRTELPMTVLSTMRPGDAVTLTVDGQQLLASLEGVPALGVLDATFGHKLMQLLRSGYRFEAAVTGVYEGEVHLVIRQVGAPGRTGRPAFPPDLKPLALRPFTRASRASDDEGEIDEGEIDEEFLGDDLLPEDDPIILDDDITA